MEVKKKCVIVIVGPTASGKTTLSLSLAKELNGEIISADSRQIYRHLNIGTAKPTAYDRRLIPHHFIDERDPTEEFNAGAFGEEGRNVIAGIFKRRHQPIVVGGSGLYIRSLIDGLFEGPAADREVRAELEQRLETDGIESLMRELREVDAPTASTIDRTKPRRVIRALEVYRLTRTPLSEHHRKAKIPIKFIPLFFGLEWDRKALYRRIEDRCQQMLEAGFMQEVEGLERRGWGPELNALNTVGYKEAFECLRGKISFDEMVRLFKQQSRRYAKRQLTWFRADSRIRWIPIKENDFSQNEVKRAISEIVNDVANSVQ